MKLLRIVVTSCVLAGAVLGVSAKGAAAADTCNSVSTSWGQGQACRGTTFYGYVDDVATDGRCVLAQRRSTSTGSWTTIARSCGAPQSYSVSYSTTRDIRMIREGTTSPWVYLWTP